jgi:hypothetical protein
MVGNGTHRDLSAALIPLMASQTLASTLILPLKPGVMRGGNARGGGLRRFAFLYEPTSAT